MGRFTQKVNRISPKYFIGKGKAEQIVNQAQMLDVNLIIFDDELSPTQVRNFLKLAESIKVIERWFDSASHSFVTLGTQGRIFGMRDTDGI